MREIPDVRASGVFALTADTRVDELNVEMNIIARKIAREKSHDEPSAKRVLRLGAHTADYKVCSAVKNVTGA